MTHVPRGLLARNLVRALEADGFVLQRARGSRRIFKHPDGRRVVVAYHALSDSFPIGTLRDDRRRRLGRRGFETARLARVIHDE